MAVRYHISPDTGRPNLCRAEVRDCPVGGDHYSSKDEARAGYEKTMASATSALQSVQKEIGGKREIKRARTRLKELQKSLAERNKQALALRAKRDESTGDERKAINASLRGLGISMARENREVERLALLVAATPEPEKRQASTRKPEPQVASPVAEEDEDPEAWIDATLADVHATEGYAAPEEDEDDPWGDDEEESSAPKAYSWD